MLVTEAASKALLSSFDTPLRIHAECLIDAGCTLELGPASQLQTEDIRLSAEPVIVADVFTASYCSSAVVDFDEINQEIVITL